MRRIVIGLLAPFVATAACSGDDGSASGTTGMATTSGGSTTTGPDPIDMVGPPCGEVENIAEPHDEVAVAGDSPEPLGGTIAPGVYLRTKSELFTGEGGNEGPTGQMFQETLRVNDDETRDGVYIDFVAGEERQYTGDFIPADQGTALTSVFRCPTEAPYPPPEPDKVFDQFGYGVAGSKLTLVYAGGVVWTYTRM